MNHLHLPFLPGSAEEAPSGLHPLWVEIMRLKIRSEAAGDFDLLPHKQNAPSTPHLMQVKPDALRGRFLSPSVSSSAGQSAMLTLLRTLNMQVVPFFRREK